MNAELNLEEAGRVRDHYKPPEIIRIWARTIQVGTQKPGVIGRKKSDFVAYGKMRSSG